MNTVVKNTIASQQSVPLFFGGEVDITEAFSENFCNNAAYIAHQSSLYLPRSYLPRLSFQLTGKIAEGWFLTRNLEIFLEQDDDGTWIASDTVVDVYGTGESKEEAIDDYCVSLIEFYEILSENQTKDQRSARLLKKLEHYLVRTS